jgi:hypothetical protein
VILVFYICDIEFTVKEYIVEVHPVISCFLVMMIPMSARMNYVVIDIVNRGVEKCPEYYHGVAALFQNIDEYEN